MHDELATDFCMFDFIVASSFSDEFTELHELDVMDSAVSHRKIPSQQLTVSTGQQPQ